MAHINTQAHMMTIQTILTWLNAGYKVYFDIDGTIIDRDDNGTIVDLIDKKHSVTPLGQYLIDNNIPLNILTFGPVTKEVLQGAGFIIESHTVFGEGLATGMVEYTEDNTASKKVEYLVDNEDHPLTTHLLKVNYSKTA